jgi:hypothetical protein
MAHTMNLFNEGDGFSTAPRGRRALRNETFNPDIQIQQPTVHNFAANLGLGDFRLANLASKDHPAHLKIGETLAYRGQTFGMINIRPADVLWCYCKDVLSSERDGMVASNAHAFASFDGALVPEDCTYEEFCDSVRPMAGAATGFFYGDQLAQTDSGVAGYVGGSWSYFHRALPEDEVFPGDLLCVRPPHTDRKVRDEEQANLPNNNSEFPAQRNSAIYYPLSFQKAHHFLQHKLTESLGDVYTGRYVYSALLPQSNSHLSAAESAVVALRNLVLFSYVVGSAVMQAYGYERPYVPGGAENGLDRTSFHQASDKLPLADAKRALYQEAPGSGVRTHAGYHSAQDMPRHLKSMSEAIKFKAAKLNMLGQVQTQLGCESDNHIADAIVGVALQGLLADPDMQGLFAIEKFFPAGEREDAYTVDAYRSVNRRPRFNTPIGMLCFMQRSLGQQFLSHTGVAFQRILNSVFGMALSNVRAGEKGVLYK